MRFSDKVKLPALKGRAFRQGGFIILCPLTPSFRTGLAGHFPVKPFVRKGRKGAGLIPGLIVKMADLLKNNLREVLAISDFSSHRER